MKTKEKIIYSTLEVLLVIITLLGVFFGVKTIDSILYSKEYDVVATVLKIDQNSVFFVDENGAVWEIKDTENYTVGERCTITLNDKNTWTEKDDIVLEVEKFS